MTCLYITEAPTWSSRANKRLTIGTGCLLADKFTTVSKIKQQDAYFQWQLLLHSERDYESRLTFILHGLDERNRHDAQYLFSNTCYNYRTGCQLIYN